MRPHLTHCRPSSTTGSSPRNLSRNLSRTALRRASDNDTVFTSTLQRGQARISSSSASTAIGRSVASARMKVLHLASANRWTGAAAPAFAEAEALRAAGIDAHYAYVGGYKLEAKLAHVDFAHPIIARHQNPASFMRSLDAIERLVHHHSFDIIHAHLTYDHWLARFAARAMNTRLARTFHSRRVLRSDPFTRSLIKRSDALFAVNLTLVDAVRGRAVTFTPPPLDQRQFTPEGPDVRARHGLAPEVPLLTTIGKVAAGRGFEHVLET